MGGGDGMADYVTKAELEATKVELLERLERMETTLLKEFRKWAVRIEAKVKVNETFSVGFNTRLDSLEDRVNDLEDPQREG
jgi:hypothetical protein